MTTTRSYSIPEDVAQFIDTLPKMERSKFVSSTLRLAIQNRNKKKALDMLDSITPVDNGDNKTSVELVRESRDRRKKKISESAKKA